MSQQEEKVARERKGVLIALVGTLVATPDAVLIRWAQKAKAELAAIVLWEMVVGCRIQTLSQQYPTLPLGEGPALRELVSTRFVHDQGPRLEGPDLWELGAGWSSSGHWTHLADSEAHQR